MGMLNHRTNVRDLYGDLTSPHAAVVRIEVSNGMLHIIQNWNPD